MNKRRFYVRAGIEQDVFGLAILFEKCEPYCAGDPNAYYCTLHFGPIYFVFCLDWERIEVEKEV